MAHAVALELDDQFVQAVWQPKSRAQPFSMLVWPGRQLADGQCRGRLLHSHALPHIVSPVVCALNQQMSPRSAGAKSTSRVERVSCAASVLTL